MKLRFAFALNKNNQFENSHFGDAYKFAIYEQQHDKLVYKGEVENIYRKAAHGDKKKGSSITKFLIEQGINVIVSREFGVNIKMVNKHFIPIIISSEQPKEVIDILQDKIHWIIDERNNSSENYKLFKIKSSILKLNIGE